MRRFVSAALAAVFVLTVLLFPSAKAEGITVVTSFYPVYIFARNVLRDIDGIEVTCMTAPETGCLHDYQLLTGDMVTLAKADVFCICGAGMEGYLDIVFEQFGNLPVIDCSEGIDLIAEEENETEETEEEGAEGHEHAVNSHIWLDVMNAVQMVTNLRDRLCELLPDYAQSIASNADAYIAMLTALDTEIAEALSGIRNHDIVTFHEAFPYFARAYGLYVVTTVTEEHEDSLSPAELLRVIEAVRAAGNPPLFTEPQYAKTAAVTIAQETGAAIYEMDPIVTGDGALTAYEDGMRANAAVLLEALSGD